MNIAAKITNKVAEFGRPVAYNELQEALKGQLSSTELKNELRTLRASGVVTSTLEWSTTPWNRLEIVLCDAAQSVRTLDFEVPALNRVQLVLIDSDAAEVPATIYDEDEYLQRLAAEQTPCFGGWVPKAKACGSCPLASSCRLAAAAILHRMMVEAAAKPEADQTIDNDADAEDDVQINLDAPEPARVERHTLVAVPISCFCSKCENLISQGTMAVVLDEGGVFHENCAP